MHFILIYYISVYASGGGITTGTAEFLTPESCEHAKDVVTANFVGVYTQPVKAFCVQK